MIKITALNETANNENEEDCTNCLTKEAQEQVAFSEYNRALRLIVQGQKHEALDVLQELLDTQILDKIEKPHKPDSCPRPMLSLKYSCFRNIAKINSEMGNYHDAIYNYWKAANLDDSDVMLWYRIGVMAIKISSLGIACAAFKKGLERNVSHWPCLDKIITVLYAIPDYMNCLVYISMALERDPTYIKGLAFRQQIFNIIPSFHECYKLYNSLWTLDPPLDMNYDQKVGRMLINEANVLRQNWANLSENELIKKPIIHLTLRKSLTCYTWLELGNCLIDMLSYMIENKLNFVSPIILNSLECCNHSLFDVVSKNCEKHSGKAHKVLHEDISCIDSDKDLEASNSFGFSDKINIIDKHHSNIAQVVESDLQSRHEKEENEDLNAISVKMTMNKCEMKQLLTKNKCEENNDSNLAYLKNYHKLVNKDNIKSNTKDFDKPKDELKFKLFEDDDCVKLNDIDKGIKTKKRRRSSLCFLTQWAWSSSKPKRPSRGRTSGRKEFEIDGNILEETLKQILPPTLLPDNTKFMREVLKNDDSINTIENLINNRNNDVPEDNRSTESSKSNSFTNENAKKYFGTDQEKLDVNNFIREFSGKYSIIRTISQVLKFLSTKWNYKWPNEMPELYMQLYLRIREHIPHSLHIFEEFDSYPMQFDAETSLLFFELYTDKLFSTQPSILPVTSLHNKNIFGIGLLSDDIGYIVFSSTRNTAFEGTNIFLIRSLWLQSQIFLYQGDIDISLKSLKLLLHHMQKFQYDTNKPFFKLRNCKCNSTVSINTVQRMLMCLQRSKKYSEVKLLYQEKKFEELSVILKDTFYFTKQTNQILLSKEIPINRTDHLKVLLECLCHLQQHEDCYIWAEACLNESWHNYLYTVYTCPDENEREKWTASILHSLEKLDACIQEVSTFVVKYLKGSRRTRLVQNLVHIVCHQLDEQNNPHSMRIHSILPWILLHYILQYEEDVQRTKSNKTLKCLSYSSIYTEFKEDEDIPASISILFKAHQFLGRHGWCCLNEGKLLIFIMNSIIPKMRYPLYQSIKDKLKEPLEQIIYCLYGHPGKFHTGVKQKPKYLEDHIKTHMNLTWDVCEILFEYYAPENLPSFESRRVDSINSDTVNLFKKMCTLIPRESDPNEKVQAMNAYLTGKTNRIPIVHKPLVSKFSNIYYLIADYYFKAASNHSWSCAEKYYMYDLCIHPTEMNSWAGLAMSTSTMMETWLNNFEPNINEDKYLTKAKIAERSYQNAIDLAPSNLIITTEFGNFLYTVHSYCSRLLKQESDSLNMNRFRVLETRKEEMIDKADKCFISANRIYSECKIVDEHQDERWLYQYMLGKILEKKNEDPPIFLKHYSKANELLHENHAEYPKRISHKNPQYLAIEALEVYYRIHASILKFLEQHEGKRIKRSLTLILEHNLKNCMQYSFMTSDSTFKDLVQNQNKFSNEEKLDTRKNLKIEKSTEQIVCNKKFLVANQAIFDYCKIDSRKRCFDNTLLSSNEKKMKLSGVSHLQLMQDVVALIDDLITDVCNKVSLSSTTTNFYEPNFGISHNSVSSTANNIDKSNQRKYHLNDQTSNKQESQLNLVKSSSVNKDTQDSNKDCEKTEDLKMTSLKFDKLDDCKRSNKSECIFSRRGSHGSTSTTQTSTTETNNSTSTSTDDSSSSDESSYSSSSNESDSESVGSDIEKKMKILSNDEIFASKEEICILVNYCLAGLEQCVLRFPEHYKSIYRLAYFYFCNKLSKNVDKSKQLLLGTYECQFYPNRKIQGLFSDRKSANFFNGIWRIPIHEIDRPGSFASHMSRCIMLLMQVLKEIGDSRMLTELCIQLRKIPDTDKKYLGDSERKQLSCQALTLCIQCLRNRIKIFNNSNIPTDLYNPKINEKMQILLDIYHTYQHIKNMQEYELSEVPKIRKLLEDAYVSYVQNPKIQGNIFELAKECCRQIIRTNKIMLQNTDLNMTPRCTGQNSSLSAIHIEEPPALNIPLLNRKSHKSNGRPRGRPPGVNKFSQILNCNSSMSLKQNDSKNSSDSMCLPNSSNLPVNAYCLNSFIEPNLVASMLSSSINASTLDAVTYFNQIGKYEDFLREYRSNFSISSSSSANKRYSSNFLNNKQTNLGTSSLTNFNNIKERPDISITPVVSHSLHSNNSETIPVNCAKKNESIVSAQFSKRVLNKPTNPVSLFKPSNVQDQIHSSLREKQTFLVTNPSLKNVGIMNSTTFSQGGQNAITSLSTTQYTSQNCTSLQHKLLSKKQLQFSQKSSNALSHVKKEKQSKICSSTSSAIHNNFVSNVPIPYASSSICNTVMTTVPNSLKCMKSHNVQKHAFRDSGEIILRNVGENDNSFSVLSQLQQQSHLEIIPQTKKVKYGIDETSISTKSAEFQNPEYSGYSTNILNTDSISVYELPRRKINTNFVNTSKEKKKYKPEKDNVEIITLDD